MMAIKYTTKGTDTKVYNKNGTHVETIKAAGTVLLVSGSIVTVGERGSCYPISSPFVGFIRVGDVKAEVVPDAPPPVTPPPANSGRLWEVRGDEELKFRGADFFNFKSRTKMENWKYGAVTPSVFRFDRIATQSPTEYRVDITPMDAAIRALNENDEARISRLYSPGTALFNRTGFPKLQYLVMSGCVLEEIAVVSNCLKFKTLTPASNTAGMNYQTHPQFVMRWDLVTYRDGATLHVRDEKGEIYWFLTTNEGVGYIPLAWVKPKG